MAYGVSRQCFLTLHSIFLQIPHFREAPSKPILCQFRFPVLHSGNSSLFQCTISGNACYREIFIVTVSPYSFRNLFWNLCDA